MENTYWLKYVHNLLRQRRLVEDKDFCFSYYSPSQDPPFNERERIRLISKKDLFLDTIRIRDNHQIANAFGRNVLDNIILKQDIDRCDECCFKLLDFVNDLSKKRAYMAVGLSRDILIEEKLNSGNPLSLNCVDVEFDYFRNLTILQKLYLGEDFSCLDKYGEFIEFEGSEDPAEYIFKLLSHNLSGNVLSSSLLGSPDPETAAENFVEFVFRIRHSLST